MSDEVDFDRPEPIADARLKALERLSALDQELELSHGTGGNPMIKGQRYTPQTNATPGEGSEPREGTSEPVAWHVKGCEYDTGCEFEYATLERGQAEAAASERCKVAPLYREPVAAWRLVHENERLRDEITRLRLTEAERESLRRILRTIRESEAYRRGDVTDAAVIDGLMERHK